MKWWGWGRVESPWVINPLTFFQEGHKKSHKKSQKHLISGHFSCILLVTVHFGHVGYLSISIHTLKTQSPIQHRSFSKSLFGISRAYLGYWHIEPYSVVLGLHIDITQSCQLYTCTHFSRFHSSIDSCLRARRTASGFILGRSEQHTFHTIVTPEKGN